MVRDLTVLMRCSAGDAPAGRGELYARVQSSAPWKEGSEPKTKGREDLSAGSEEEVQERATPERRPPPPQGVMIAFRRRLDGDGVVGRVE